MTTARDRAAEFSETLLFDVQAPAGQVNLNPAEQRVMDLVTRSITGAIVMWFSLSQLVGEITDYRSRRIRPRVEVPR